MGKGGKIFLILAVIAVIGYGGWMMYQKSKLAKAKEPWLAQVKKEGADAFAYYAAQADPVTAKYEASVNFPTFDKVLEWIGGCKVYDMKSGKEVEIKASGVDKPALAKLITNPQGGAEIGDYLLFLNKDQAVLSIGTNTDAEASKKAFDAGMKTLGDCFAYRWENYFRAKWDATKGKEYADNAQVKALM